MRVTPYSSSFEALQHARTDHYPLLVIPSWRFWSRQQKAMLIVIAMVVLGVLAGLVLAATSLPQSVLGPILTGVGALIAACSLVVTALVSFANWSRSKKQATLEAWTRWVQDSLEDRKAFTAVFGQNVGLTDEQARHMLDGGVLTVGGEKLTGEAAKDLRRSMQRTLAGLERLAVGVEQQIYDADVIMEIGGTLVVGTLTRYQPYVTYLQRHPDGTRRHALAYRALEGLVAEVEGSRNKRQYYDRARVAKIRRATTKGRSGSTAIRRT